MDAIEKLLNKISKKDKKNLLKAMLLIQGSEISGIKLKGVDVYRVRIGNYRILYKIEKKKIVIVGLRRRNEKTYK